MLASLKFSQTKNPRPGSEHTKYVMFDLEDMAGSIRCILWPEEFARHGHLAQADATLVVRGVIDRRPGSEETNIVVNELIPLEELQGRFTRGLMLRVDEQQHGEPTLDALYEILRGYPGNCELQMVLCLADGSRAYLKCDRLRVDLNAEMRSRVDSLLGPGNVRLISAPPTPAAAPQRGRERGALARR
jgi:DNA polymerase-3 subunit alpha